VVRQEQIVKPGFSQDETMPGSLSLRMEGDVLVNAIMPNCVYSI